MQFNRHIFIIELLHYRLKQIVLYKLVLRQDLE